MILQDIRERITQAKRTMEKIAPQSGAYLVVMVGVAQIEPVLLIQANCGLGGYPEAFVPGRMAARVQHLWKRWRAVEARIKANNKALERAAGAARDRRMRELDKQEKALKLVGSRLRALLERAPFHEIQCELRFHTLDMHEIQRIKQHPIIRQIGKTDESPASIRVVVG